VNKYCFSGKRARQLVQYPKKLKKKKKKSRNPSGSGPEGNGTI